MAGTFTIGGGSASEPAGSRTFGPYTMQGALVVSETIASPLVAGDNDFTIPESAVAVWIVPSTPATTTLSLRTDLNSTDAGLPWNGQLPFGPYPLPPSAELLIINAGADQASPLVLAFI